MAPDSSLPVVVIGAGAAGLSAARHLAEASCRVTILEARERVGGRIHTIPDGVAHLELGAEFVHGEPAATLDLLEEAGLQREVIEPVHFGVVNGRMAPTDMMDDDWHELLRLARRQQADLTVEEFLRDATARNPALADAAEFMRTLLQGFDAADPRRASLRVIVQEWSGDTGVTAGQGRVVEGYGALVAHLTASLDRSLVSLRTGCQVRGIRWSPDGAEVTYGTDGGSTMQAAAVIVTLPLSILQLDQGQPSAVWFDPPLTTKARAIAGLAVGPVHRVLLRYPQSPWEALLGGEAKPGSFLHAPGQPFRTFWTGPAGSPWLTAWSGGPPAARLGAGSADSIVGQAIVSARAMFSSAGHRPADPVETRFHDWQRDPFAMGAYSYVTAGAEDARARLAAPVEGVLFFAGEATEASGESATVAGALMSGERAAAEYVRSLGD